MNWTEFADISYLETLERHGIDTSEGIDSCDIDHGGALT